MDINIQDFNIVPVNERYYGKSKDILKIEKAIGEYRKKYMPKTADEIFKNPQILKGSYTDAKLFDISKAIKDAFGFKAVSLIIKPASLPNAATLPVICGTTKDIVDYSSGHPRFKKEAEISCIIEINTPLIFNPEMTDEEVTAVLLHEIGHNFQFDILKDAATARLSFNVLTVVSAILRVYGTVDAAQQAGLTPFKRKTQKITSAATALVLVAIALCCSKSHKKRNAEIEEFAEKIKNDTEFRQKEEDKANAAANKAAKQYNELYGEKSTREKLYVALSPVFIILSAIALPGMMADLFGEWAGGTVVTFAKNILKTKVASTLLTKNANYNNEKIADNFAAELGYGVQSATAEAKMANFANTNKPGSEGYSRAIDNISKLMWLPCNMLTDILECHPGEVNRSKLYYKELCNDLEKGYFDPAMKSELEKNIADIDAFMEASDKAKKNIDNADDPNAERSVVTGVIDLIVSVGMNISGGIKEAISKIEPHYFTTTPNISDSKEEARRRALEKSNYIDTTKLK